MTRRALLAAKVFLAAVAVLQAVFFARGLAREPVREYGDTQDYERVAKALAAGELSVIHTDNRPPGYPLVLLASQALGVRATVGGLLLNRAGALIALAAMPGPSSVLVVASYLLLASSSMLITYENTVLTESVMPFFLLMAWVLGAHARMLWRRGRLGGWVTLLALQTLLLASLKPAFKLIAVLQIIWVAGDWFYRNRKLPQLKIVGAWCVLVLCMLTVNEAVFRGSGKQAGPANKALSVLSSRFLPELTEAELAQLSPQEAADYHAIKAHRNDPQGHLKNTTVVPYERGAQLYERLYPKYFFQYTWASIEKMALFIWYSGWGEDYSALERRVGWLTRGMSALGCLVISILFGAAGALFLRWQKAAPDSAMLWELAILFSYSFSVQMLVAPVDVGRLSLPWVIPGFMLLCLSWVKITHSILERKG